MLGLGNTLVNNKFGNSFTGILNKISVPTATAYSLRLLNKDYTGNAIRVRRSSDNAETNIGFVNGKLDTATLLTFCGAGSGFVTTWYDQSGNGRNATQTTANNQPRIVNIGVLETLNGKVTVKQTINTQNLQIPAFSGMTSALINSIYSIPTGVEGACPWALSNSQSEHAPYLGELIIAPFTHLRRNLGPFAHPSGNAVCLTATVSGGVIRGFRNTVQTANTGSSIFTLPTTYRQIFGVFNTAIVSELVIFSSVGTTQDRLLLENNQMQYYGIS